ncbi:MAG: hypothetical protein IT272_09790 [Chitinophagales bacterium]|nr:hypothetical protein [Sphingobacteriales bacterium]MBP9140064.1 hypothetical protein [Chitinophagales bacterium]MDA0197854.1 M43 family zinc metalloprotease [Bacteroidota bacterium]MBK6889925.1 hypothetical protein [Sphingobacteriales bacterium]MBL0249015.1 hypothetical protein [Sphingobacteriales bacterium]
MPQYSIEKLKNYALNAKPLAKEQTETVYLPMIFHIVGDDDGKGYFAALEVFRLLCETNEQWQQTNIQFYLADDIKFWNNTDWYDHDYDDGEKMMKNAKVKGTINIFIVENPADNCGYFSGWGDAIAVAKSCSDDGSTTLAHELGHYFGLPHTFLGWEGGEIPKTWEQELVDGSNCSITGDYFCDTPADYLWDRWPCPYKGTLKDPKGNIIHPDETLYMSYAYDECSDRFSPEQIAYVQTYLEEERKNLIKPDAPKPVEVDKTVLYYPADGAKNINPNKVLLAWKKSLGAESYFIQIQPMLPNATNTYKYVTDTSVWLKLDAGVKYFYAIMPFSSANVCAPPVKGFFTTGATTDLYVKSIGIEPPLCHDSQNGSVTHLEIAGGAPPYTYMWSNGATEAKISGLKLGKYTVTVTDANQTTSVLTVWVPAPTVLTAVIQQTAGNELTGQPQGGTPPFSYAWSNGSTGQSIANLIEGNYDLTITDANGCTATAQTVLLNVSASITQPACYGYNNGKLNLTIAGGLKPYEFEWSNGATTQNLSGVEAGNYTVTITDNNNLKVILPYNISQPSEIEIQVETAGTTAFATVTGGNPPYLYQWANGQTEVPTALKLPLGDQKLVVFDADNCSGSILFNVKPFTGTDFSNTTAQQNWVVTPTLIEANTQNLTVILSNNKNGNKHQFAAYLQSVAGYKMPLIASNIYPDNNTAQEFQIALPNNLTSGLYFLHLSNGIFEQTTKLVVLK